MYVYVCVYVCVCVCIRSCNLNFIPNSVILFR